MTTIMLECSEAELLVLGSCLTLGAAVLTENPTYMRVAKAQLLAQPTLLATADAIGNKIAAQLVALGVTVRHADAPPSPGLASVLGAAASLN